MDKNSSFISFELNIILLALFFFELHQGTPKSGSGSPKTPKTPKSPVSPVKPPSGHSGKPHTGKPHTGKPHSGKPHTGKPHSGKPHHPKPEMSGIPQWEQDLENEIVDSELMKINV